MGPNPTTGLLQLRLNSLQEKETVQVIIWNMAGQLLLKKEIILQQGWQDEELDLRPYPAGAYMVKISTNCGEILEKIVRIRE